MSWSAAAAGGLSSRAELPLLCLGDMASERNVHCNLMLLLHPSALPSFPPCRSPPSLCSSTPAHPARRWVLHSHPLVSASHTRDTVNSVETPRTCLWGSRVRLTDASTGCVRTDHVSSHSDMYVFQHKVEGANTPAVSGGIALRHWENNPPTSS